jgi:DNA polymerase III sliding clamp (beta) subunit (PCNA family)
VGQPCLSGTAGLFDFNSNHNERITMKSNIIALPVTELKTALIGMGKIIGRGRHGLPVLTSVRVARNDSGIVTLEGTDLDSTATFSFKETNAGPTAQLLVPFERLQKAVKQTNDRVELSLDAKDNVTVRTFWRDTPIEEKVHVPYIDDFPPAPKVDGEGVVLAENLRDAFWQAFECASEDESRPVINSVYLDVDDKKSHYVVSTNGRILFSANSFHFGLKQSLAVPTRKFLGWNGWWTGGEASLAVKHASNDKETTWIKVTADQWTFITRGIDTKYPIWKNVIPTERVNTRITIPSRAIDSVLEIIARLPGDDLPNHDIILNVAKNTLVLQGRAKSADKPVAVAVIEANVEGKAAVVAINRYYLVKALRFGLNQFDIIDELTPVVITNGGKRMIIMPIHPGNSATPKPQPKPAAPAATSTSSTLTKTTPTETSTATQPVNEERKDMPRQITVAPVNGEHEQQQQDTPLKQLIQQIENIRTALKDVLGDLGDCLDIVKKAEKEKRLADKEVEAIREKVRDIQSMSI